MSTSTPTAPPAVEPLPRERPSTRPTEATKPHRQPPYAVILHNDDVNGFDYVISVLRKVFNYGFLKAFWLTARAHFQGKAVVWSGSLEVAELKADQIRSCGPDPNMKAQGATTLTVTVEPMA